MKKILIGSLILTMIFLISGCYNYTGATYSCCDVGCYTNLPCSQYPCPTGYQYQELVDQCVPTSGTVYIGQVCFPEQDKLCKKAYWNSGYFYCDTSEVVICPNGCSNGQCNGNPIPSCSEGYMVCSDGIDFDTRDTSGDPYICLDGEWSKTDTCQSEEVCEERSATNAWCKSNLCYCVNNNFNCISCQCSRDGAYQTIDECQNNVPYYCLSSDRKTCRLRYGGCNSGELYFKGDGSEEDCTSSICGTIGNNCCEGDKCNIGLTCSEVSGLTYPDGSPVKQCVGGDTEEKCEAICASEAWLLIGDKVIIPNYLCIQKCKLAEEFRPLFIGIIVVLSIILWLVGYSMLKRRFNDKKEKWIRWVIPSIIVPLMAWAFYYYIFIIAVFTWVIWLILVLYTMVMLIVGYAIRK